MEPLKQKGAEEQQLGAPLGHVESTSQMAICVLWPLWACQERICETKAKE